MWPFAVVLIAAAAAVLFLRARPARERRRGLLLTAGAAGVLAALGMGLVGLPGALLYELGAPWVRLVLGEGYHDLGDAAWPAAIVISLAWPASLVIAYTVAHGLLGRRRRWVRWMALVLVPYAFAVSLAFWAHLAARGG